MKEMAHTQLSFIVLVTQLSGNVRAQKLYSAVSLDSCLVIGPGSASMVRHENCTTRGQKTGLPPVL